MRRSGWIPPGVSLALWIAAVALPALALLGALFTGPATDVEVRNAGALLATSTAWAAAVAVAAIIVGWAPGRLLGRALPRRWSLPLAALLLAPVCLPAYVIFYAWWQSWPADSALYRWAVETDRVQLVKAVTLFVGFVCWSWPLAAWCVAGFAADTPAYREEILELDGAGPLRRLADRLRCDGRGLALGGLIIFLFVFNNTASFDVAQFFTFGYELKAIDALNASPRSIITAALPAMAVAAVGAAVVWWLLGRAHGETPIRTGPPTRGPMAATGAIWVVSAAVPVLLFLRNLSPEASVGTFVTLYGTDLVNTIMVAVACGVLGAVVTVGLAATWQDHRKAVRCLGAVQSIGWLLAALVPGTIVGVALEGAYNHPGLDGLIYTNPAILGLGHMARFGFIAALLARWLTLQEPKVLADMRRLDGADNLTGYVVATWPRLLAGAGAAFAVIAVLSMSELSVSARLQPPGFSTIAGAVLNAVHYQRPDTVMLAVVALILTGVGAGFLAVGGWWPWRRFSARPAIVMICGAVAVVGNAGCGRAGVDPGDGPEPLDMRAAFGTPGRSLGQFSYPRGIAVDGEREVVYVVDKTARVQRFGFDGEPQLQWRMPKWENGKPTGLGVADDGRVFVADTHYHRVIVYDPEGNETNRFGAYGQGPGEFIFPTDVAFGPQGRVYVSEYGGNERIDVFDDTGGFLFSFGGPGQEVGRYNRPQALAFSADREELYIADACNHRVVVVTPQGEPLRVIGEPGRGPGQLAYPYDVVVLDDHTLLVCEYGNNRIQHFSSEGECLGVYGGVGTGDGEVRYPWGIDGTGRTIFVLDSGNNRVQRVGIRQ